MTGYRELARQVRNQRRQVAEKRARAHLLAENLRDRLRDPVLLLPAFLGGLASGYVAPRAVQPLRRLLRTARFTKLVVLPLIAILRHMQASSEAEDDRPESPAQPHAQQQGNKNMEDRNEAYQQALQAEDGTRIHYRYWPADPSPRAVVQLLHGAAEHSGRYHRFARALTAAGYAVYASDHRGHGQTRVRSGELGDAGPDAWNAFVEDQAALGSYIRRAHPGTPLIMFGHSMGSFIAQDFISRYPARLDGLILCGTAYAPPPPPEALQAARTAAEEAPLASSEIWAGMFADFNQPFTGQPGFDWLSRDPDEVRKYLEDPECGFVFNNALVRDFFHGMAALRTPEREATMPPDLPILIVQGSLDPVGGNLETANALLTRFAELGMTRVEHRFYAEARHELLNETNREEVEQDILDWLERQLRATATN